MSSARRARARGAAAAGGDVSGQAAHPAQPAGDRPQVRQPRPHHGDARRLPRRRADGAATPASPRMSSCCGECWNPERGRELRPAARPPPRTRSTAARANPAEPGRTGLSPRDRAIATVHRSRIRLGAAATRPIEDGCHEAEGRPGHPAEGAGPCAERGGAAQHHPDPGQRDDRRARRQADADRDRHGDRHRRGRAGQHHPQRRLHRPGRDAVRDRPQAAGRRRGRARPSRRRRPAGAARRPLRHQPGRCCRSRTFPR